MTHTENYNLNMPDDTDFYDVEHMNENMETIDTAMHDVEVQTENVAEKIGSSSDGGNTTIMGKLNNLVESIKKGQAVYTPNGSKTFALATPSTAPKFTINASTKEKHFLTGTPFKCKFNGYLYIDIDLYLTVDSTAESSQLRVWILQAKGTQIYTAASPMATTH